MKTHLKTVLLTLAVLGLSCLWTIWQPLKIDMDIMHTFFEVFGVTYAIIVGFALYLVSESFDAFRRTVNAEVDDLQDLRDYLVYVDRQDELVEEIKGKIRKYVEHVLDKEWPAMAAGQHVEMDTPAVVYDIMRSINKIRRTNDSDLVALEKLISTMASITTHRMERLNAAQERLPGPFRQLILILSGFLILTFSMMPRPVLTERLLLGGLVTLTSVLIILVIFDMADPFRGLWQVEPGLFRTLLEKL
jgi:hypothetical protein